MSYVRGLSEQDHATPVHGRLVERIYATVTDPGAWSDVLKELIASTDSRSARLLVLNSDATQVLSSLKQNIDDHYHQQYTEYFVNACPWRPELRLKPPGRLYSTSLHFSCPQSEYLRSEFFNDWAGPQDIHHGVCGTIYQDAGRTVQLLVQRTGGQGHYTERDTGFFNSYVPHLQHALHLAAQVADRCGHAEAVAMAAEAERLPYFLLDHALRVIHCHPAAEALLAGETPLRLRSGKIETIDRADNRHLQCLLKSCLDAADSRLLRSAGGNLQIQRPDGCPLYLLARPIHPDIPALTPSAAGYVALYVHDPAVEVAIDPEWLRRLYALSDAEIRVAAALLATADPAEAAKRCCISRHTVRSHLKAIFAKTGARNQADLMKRLLDGPVRLS